MTAGSEVEGLTPKEHLASLFEGLVGDRVRAVATDGDLVEFETAVIKAFNELAAVGASRLIIASDGKDFKTIEARIKDVIQRKFRPVGLI